MKTIRIHKHGGTEELKIDNLEIPQISDNEVLIKTKTASLNHLDIWVRNGIPGVPLPLIMGSDAAGVVQEVGKDVAQNYSLNTRDEVFVLPFRSCGKCDACLNCMENMCRDFHIPGESTQGVQSEYIAVDAKYVLPKPQNLNWQEMAALPLAAMTAYHMLVPKVNLIAGQTVLVYGASSGVGSMGIQIAKALGATVITTVGSAEKAKLAQQLGADFVIDYNKQPIGKTVRELTANAGVDVVFEHTGTKTWNESLRALKRGGKLVTCGATTGPIVKIDIRALFIKHQQYIGSTMGTRQDMVDILQLVKQDKLRPIVDKAFPFTEIVAAHKHLEAGNQFGKVILEFES